MYSFYIIVFFLVAITWVLYRDTQKDKLLPPGPTRLPIIGNIHQLPQENPWRTYQQWSKKYGPIFSLRAGGDTIIMIGNHAVARDLLDKRSNIYSSRPRLVMGECYSLFP